MKKTKLSIPKISTCIIITILTLNILSPDIAQSNQPVQPHQTIQQHYHFDIPTSYQDTIKPIRLLLPPSTTIKDITVTPSNTEPLPFVTTKNLNTRTRSFSPCQTINTSHPTLYTSPDIQYFRGYSILNMNLHTIQHETSSFYKDITLTIDLQPSSLHPLYRGGIDQEELLSKIDNPEALINYPSILHSQHQSQSQPQSQPQTQFYDYIIITTNNLKNSHLPYNLNTLIEQRESQGLSCTIKTVEDIQTEYTGIDTPEKIRNFIKHAYTTYGVTYILLAGNTNHVPIRYLYDIDGDEPTRQLPSDLYYQCLDGNYNYDNDCYWGERLDGPDGSLIDLYAEVYIGRAPADDTTDISSFVEKTITYENHPLPCNTKCLSIGQKVWDGCGGWGSNYAERCIDNCTDYNQNTSGIPSDIFNITKLYDESHHTWTKTTLMKEINNGTGIINHVGHGTITSTMGLTTSDITSLTNTDKYCFLYSQACNSGKLTTQDNCFAEQWINTRRAGGFAAIMNTGKGYGSEADYDGPDNRYAREFFDALFSPDEKISRLGKANQDSKEDNIWRIHESEKNMYHVYYDTLLFGDPYVQIKGAENPNQMPPHTPNKPSGPTDGSSNIPYTFTVNTTDPNNDQIKYIWDFNDETIVTKWYTSGDTCTISHTWDTSGTYHIKVKAKDSNMAESAWSPILTFTVGDNDNPLVTITKPEKTFYIQNTKIFPSILRSSIILGKIDIIVNATDSTSLINNVTFYIDNITVKVDTEVPFTYTWNEKSFGRHTIKVIAYDLVDNYSTDEITVWKFF